VVIVNTSHRVINNNNNINNNNHCDEYNQGLRFHISFSKARGVLCRAIFEKASVGRRPEGGIESLASLGYYCPTIVSGH
jgi:hypothetical protein